MNALLFAILGAMVKVTVDPVDAAVELDGIALVNPVLEGPHQLVVWKRGYFDAIQHLTITDKDITVKIKLQPGISAAGQVRTSPFERPTYQGWTQISPGIWRGTTRDKGDSWNVVGPLEGGLPEVYMLRLAIRGDSTEARSIGVFGWRPEALPQNWTSVTLIGYRHYLWAQIGTSATIRLPNSGAKSVSVTSHPFKTAWVEVKDVQVQDLTVDDLRKMKLLKPEEK